MPFLFRENVRAKRPFSRRDPVFVDPPSILRRLGGLSEDHVRISAIGGYGQRLLGRPQPLPGRRIAGAVDDILRTFQVGCRQDLGHATPDYSLLDEGIGFVDRGKRTVTHEPVDFTHADLGLGYGRKARS